MGRGGRMESKTEVGPEKGDGYGLIDNRESTREWSSHNGGYGHLRMILDLNTMVKG
jgi:hypothetical protein